MMIDIDVKKVFQYFIETNEKFISVCISRITKRESKTFQPEVMKKMF